MPSKRAYILCYFARFSSLYTSWLDQLDMPVEVLERSAADWQVPADAGIVITHMHYRWEEVHALRKVLAQGQTPVLVLADGILEYRNLYEHPDLADGCIFQPLIGHKLACIGRAQARTIESWGNVGKCEVVGLPRLDSIAFSPPGAVRTQGPFRLLIATANTPAFNAQQRESVVESLMHFKQRMEANGRVNGRPLEVTWRLTSGLELDLGLPVEPRGENRLPLSQAIDEADAVITTPSTLYLESVLKGRPTAILDFYNSPHFVSAAWTINAPKHFNVILSELAHPPTAKMLFQETELRDQLECRTPASPRLLELIREMVAAGNQAQANGQPLCLPPRILTDPQFGFATVEPRFDLGQLFPDNPNFANREIAALQIELNLAIERLGSMPADLSEHILRSTEFRKQIDELNQRNQSMTQRLSTLRDSYRRLRSFLDRRRGKPIGTVAPGRRTANESPHAPVNKGRDELPGPKAQPRSTHPTTDPAQPHDQGQPTEN